MDTASVNQRGRTSGIPALLTDGPRAVNIGVELFAEALRAHDPAAVSVDWRPPSGGATVAAALARLSEPARAARIAAANERVVERLIGARPHLVDVRRASDVVPVLRDRVLLHAGPPLVWDEMTGPMQGAAVGAVLFEGWAETSDAATRLLERGEISFLPCHTAGGVGPMGGITSGSMPLLIVEDHVWGGQAFCNFNEGIGRVLRFGANGPEVLDRLRWLRDVAGPALSAALRLGSGVDLRTIMSRALTMGDEMHQRNIAATLLLLRETAPLLARTDLAPGRLAEVMAFIGQTDQFFLNVAMAACKAIADAGHAAGEGSSIVTALARNGVRFGVRMGSTGDRWFTAPVNTPTGLYFGGYTAADGNPDIGDSAITETIGLGGMAMAAAPAVVPYVGAGGFGDALRITREMQQIALAENPDFALPTLDFAGVPTGIDVRLVARTGIVPIINTGIAHREAGIGQVGAGTVLAPLACFEQAVVALAEVVP
ncbi:MAG: DUF1116 domain-containing protein [Chloroflexi bacterium]|nr:DUF1116 domain-containing protein [Chloroflexota bacterium]